MKYRASAIALIIATGLSACHKSAPQQQQAAGEILPGSASDAMLPVDTVKSQPPLAPHADKVEGKAAATDAAVDAAAAPEDAAPANKAAEAPAQ